MRIWQLEPRAGSLQVEPAMIADLLASITEPDSASLPRAILNLVRGEIEAINCALFLLPAGSQPWLIGHAELPERHHVRSVGGSYADSYYRRDLGLQHALRLSRQGAGATMLLHQNASDIHDREYRLRCYDEVDTCQRFAVVRPINGRDSLMVGIYRASAAMSPDELEFLSQTARWVGEAAVQRLRARASVIITGADTVLTDQARLTVRAEELGLNAELTALAIDRPPLRVLVDGRLRVPLHTPFFQAGPALVATCAAAAARDRFLEDGHELLAVPGSNGHVDLRKLLLELAARGANEVLVEAGPKLAGAFARAGLVDEFQLFVAPKFLGSSARPLLDWSLARMAEAQELEIRDIRAVGNDWRITAVPKR